MSVHIKQIFVNPERCRKSFDSEAIASLSYSISNYGLFHPLVVQRREDGYYELIAGERRLRAITKLYHDGLTIPGIPKDHVPVTLFADLDTKTAKEIELEENIRRVDLSWKEVAKATAELHAMRKAEDPNWTASKTAEEIKDRGGYSINITQIRNRTLLAEHMDKPEIASAPTEKQAMKNLARMMENDFKTAMAGTMDMGDTRHCLAQIDAREGIRTLVPAESVDIVITDPPYGIGANTFGVQTVHELHAYKDDWESVEELIAETLGLITAACKPQAHLYLFCDFSKWEEIREMLTILGWQVWPRPLIWAKAPNEGYAPIPDYGPRYTYETILYANRGRKMVQGVFPDVISATVTNREHAAQKPVDLYINLLKRSAIPGSIILDPFCGSGTVFTAANELKLTAYGFDIDPIAITLAGGKLA
jgi:site-specific DNA-methyltransferase (adenine-specific)